MQKSFYYTWTTARSHAESSLGPLLQAEKSLSQPLLIGGCSSPYIILVALWRTLTRMPSSLLCWGAQKRTRSLGPLRTSLQRFVPRAQLSLRSALWKPCKPNDGKEEPGHTVTWRCFPKGGSALQTFVAERQGERQKQRQISFQVVLYEST